MTSDIPKPASHENGRTAAAPPSEGRVSTDVTPGTGRILALAIVGLAILLSIAFVIAFLVRHHSEGAAERQASATSGARAAVAVVSVQPTPDSYPLTLPGQTAGWFQSTIFARVDGYIQSWSADIGDPVKQGQMLALIDTPEINQQLIAAHAKAAASDAHVNVVESDVSIAKVTFDRWWNSKPGVVSEQERQEKKATYESALANLAEAKAQAQLDMAEVGRYEAMKAFERVTAPYDGVITARHVDVGDLVTAGSGSNTTSLYGIAQSNVIRVFVDVPQKAAAAINIGLAAHVASDQFPARLFQGKVARSSMSMDPQTRTQRTEVDIPNADLALVPGMYVQVTFELNQRGLLEVPAAAILFRPGGLQVAVVDSDSKVNFRPITVAKDDGDTVELGTGVKAGDRVAVNISSAIIGGEQVDTVDADKDEPAAPPAITPSPTTETTGATDGQTVSEPASESGTGNSPSAPVKAPAASPGVTSETAQAPAR